MNEKVFLYQWKCCIETRFSRCLSQEFAGVTAGFPVETYLGSRMRVGGLCER